MKTLTMLLSVSALTFGGLSVSGCALTTAGVKKGDERNFARSLNDVNAARAIKARMSRAEGFDLGGVDVEVAEGIVLLSGNVQRQEDRIEAERIAWSAPRIDQVGNEILLKADQGHIRNVQDGIVNSSVRARLVANSVVKARNYNIEVHDGIVYLLGVARSPQELESAAYTASTTKGVREVISYVRIAGDQNHQYASGPAQNGQPAALAAAPSYTAPNYSTPQNTAPGSTVQQYTSPQTMPDYSAPIPLDDDAIESGEPYYLDPLTGERVEIPEGVTPIPYVPDTGPGSLGAGGAPLPPGVRPSEYISSNSAAPASEIASMPTSLPSDAYLGNYRTGAPGTAVSVIESAPYRLDPVTGEMIPVSYGGN